MSALRVAVVLPSWKVPRWVARTLAELQKADFVSLDVVTVRDEALGAGRPSALYSAYAQADRALFKRLLRQPDAFEITDVRDDVTGSARGQLDPKADALDVIVSFAPGTDALAAQARCGVWSYDHGGDGFWEMAEGRSLSDVTLHAQTAAHGRRVLYGSHAKTNTVSLHLNRNGAHWKGSDFAVRALREVHRRGWEAVWAQAPEVEVTPQRSPDVVGMARFFGQLATSAVKKGYERLHDEHYFLAFRPRGRSLQDNDHPWQMIAPPPDRFYADPFMIARDGRHHVFFEDSPYATRRAHISHLVIEADGRVGPSEPVLKTEYHLSYPFLFEWQGETWMVPESRSAGRIDLFRAVKFPGEWKHETTLLDVPAVDSTLFPHEGRWWMFTNMAVGSASTSDELHLWSAPVPTGPWTPHAGNPIVSDVRGARCAGSVILQDGKAIRPAQDSERRYGYRVGFHQIDALNDREYREHLVHRLEPTWHPDNLGSHTYNAAGTLEIIDGRTFAPKWRRARRG